MPPNQGKHWAGANGDWITTGTHPWNWELFNVYNHRQIPLPAILEFEGTYKDFEFIDADGQHVHLLKIAICEVPTTTGKYKDFSNLAIFDSSIVALHGPDCIWSVLQNQFNLFPDQDAIFHKGHVFATTQVGTVYVWNDLKWGNIPCAQSILASSPWM